MPTFCDVDLLGSNLDAWVVHMGSLYARSDTGSFGDVYLALDQTKNEEVAVQLSN